VTPGKRGLDSPVAQPWLPSRQPRATISDTNDAADLNARVSASPARDAAMSPVQAGVGIVGTLFTRDFVDVHTDSVDGRGARCGGRGGRVSPDASDLSSLIMVVVSAR